MLPGTWAANQESKTHFQFLLDQINPFSIVGSESKVKDRIPDSRCTKLTESTFQARFIVWTNVARQYRTMEAEPELDIIKIAINRWNPSNHGEEVKIPFWLSANNEPKRNPEENRQHSNLQKVRLRNQRYLMPLGKTVTLSFPHQWRNEEKVG